jgi:hypothetical protein
MATGLKIDIQSCSFWGLGTMFKGIYFSMTLTIFFMMALANDLTIFDNHASNQGVGECMSQS